MKRKQTLSLLCALALVLSLLPMTVSAAGSTSLQSGATTVAYGRANGIVKADGSLWMWGNDDRGQVGYDGQVDIYEPPVGLSIAPTMRQSTPVKIMDNVVAVDVGWNCSGALKADGTLWMWGGGLYGELGDGDGSMHIQWEPIKVLDNVVSFDIGGGHVGAVRADGSLYMWGNNEYGQLNLTGVDYAGSDDNSLFGGILFGGEGGQTKPVRVMGGVAQVSCGDRNTAIIKTDGSLWMCGDNTYGQLGNGQCGEGAYSSSFIKVMDNVAAVACGDFSVVIQKDGSVWEFGETGLQSGNATVTITSGYFSTSQNEVNVQTIPKKTAQFAIDEISWTDGSVLVKTDGTVLALYDTYDEVLATDIAVWGADSLYVKKDGSAWWWTKEGDEKFMDGAATGPLTGLQATTQSPKPTTPTKPTGSGSFTDVKSGQWFYPFVTELAQLGGVNGYQDGTFKPNGTITRAEVCTILLGSFPVDQAFESAQISQATAQAERTNGSFWANGNIGRANLCGITDFGYGKGEWGKAATREEIAYMLNRVYAWARKAEGNNEPLSFYNEANLLIGDYRTAVAGSKYENYVLWLYSNGIVTGVNSNGDFTPKSNTTRAECCTMVVTLLHPESWKQIDWTAVISSTENTGTRLPDGVDFKGKSRIHYSNDVAYEFCRALEQQIGIQIFYLPEWTPKADGLIQYSDMEEFDFDRDYFNNVLAELRTMKQAYDLYPEGFLKEVAQKKGNRGVEIILCPYTFEGVQSYGVHVYDYSSDAKKVDQVYYTGSGDSQYYSHEMGHMVMSSAAVLNGWNATCSKWESLSTSPMSYVSTYAMSSRPEDWADTWAYLWHRTNNVISGCSDSGLKAKVQYMSQILDKNYSTFDSSKTPWTSVLN